jgi:aconitate hydratase
LTARDRHVIANTPRNFPGAGVRPTTRCGSASPKRPRPPHELSAEVAIKVGDKISTDEIMPTGAEALPYRSNIAKLAEYARIHWQNLVNFGVLPLEFTSATDYGDIDLSDELAIDNVVDALTRQQDVTVHNRSKGTATRLRSGP